MEARGVGGHDFIRLLRSLLLPLMRVILCCRSSDLTCIHRGDLSSVRCIRFRNDGAGDLASVGFRFYRPKQRNTLPTRSHGYTDWVDVDVMDAANASICLARLTKEYFDITAPLPRADDRLFLSESTSVAHERCHWGLSAERCAKVMGAAMKAAGIPADFLPHSARHAGQAYMKSRGLSDDEVMARANMSARTYVTHYRRRVRQAGADQ